MLQFSGNTVSFGVITQVVTEYSEDQLELVLEACERMNAHLTAAVVSNNPLFLQASGFVLSWMFTFMFIYLYSHTTVAQDQ
jgi:hypothetical protein